MPTYHNFSVGLVAKPTPDVSVGMPVMMPMNTDFSNADNFMYFNEEINNDLDGIDKEVPAFEDPNLIEEQKIEVEPENEKIPSKKTKTKPCT